MTQLKPYVVILAVALSLMGCVRSAIMESRQAGSGLPFFVLAFALAMGAYWLWSQK